MTETETTASAPGRPASLRRTLLYGLPVLVFAGLVVAFAIGLTRDPAYLPSALIDRSAPGFDLAALTDRPGVATTDLGHGKVVLVNFFASWCVPCKVEHPTLMRLAGAGTLPVYGINYKDKPEDALAFLKALGDPYGRIGVDRDGRVAIDFGLYGVPETYIVDKAGRVRYRYPGPVTEEVWRQEILPLVEHLQRS
jgi:cytochrome c biogenesis protein CcmG/thiol:disulfide interchange protein DsbE